VEDASIVVVTGAKCQEILASLRAKFTMELNLHVTHVRVQRHRLEKIKLINVMLFIKSIVSHQMLAHAYHDFLQWRKAVDILILRNASSNFQYNCPE